MQFGPSRPDHTAAPPMQRERSRMRLVVATEARFALGPDGIPRSDTGGRAYPFWQRYLVQYCEVSVLARVKHTASTAGSPVTGPGVGVIPLPGGTGWTGALRLLTAGRSRIAEVCRAPDTAYLARLPGIVGSLLVHQVDRARRPYGVEVVGDPYDVFSAGIGGKVAAPLLRHFTYRLMQRHCARAAAIAYVTKSRLQERYPPRSTACTTSYSDVDLPDEAFRTARPRVSAGPLVLVAVGTQSQPYKGHDVLLSAAAALRDRGLEVRVRLVGDGRLRPRLARQAAQLGIVDTTTFVGQVPAGPAVRAELDRADVFVLPSRTEGLPRALIEAMARRLPCVASDVGGVRELLPAEDLCPAGDPAALADLLEAVITAPDRRRRMGERNFTVAQEYRERVLAARRAAFYDALEKTTRTTTPRAIHQGVRR
ncbi:glycosyltransferase [Pseudonocardia lacus]|uniref:glycosyltransferase n=1 Tax=Pseudonocardia lacus TaxID=2835865 RepID=UPI001BDCE593|nr:glycosyltransferase [Pseudonocardia lacus]